MWVEWRGVSGCVEGGRVLVGVWRVEGCEWVGGGWKGVSGWVEGGRV